MSQTEKVNKLLDSDVIEIQLAHRYANAEDKNQLRPENYRFVAYRNIFFLVYGRTKAKMSRMPLPSCLVIKIRNIFPDPDNQYKGFCVKRRRF
jgi:hypothetical protein